ncbi:SusC/RagA family TonB-linked outer membrane protein [Pedobacter sp. UBA4863]|uniref:SusC/RagA family TonB-linked outer membrane protein n=1 Tax=Pedobacter sp. UBA4863 TaxID=1947060 RepID=UPI0025F09F85|nr:SusC/RagA family TonB-linked outer membrane protein [Pedobacter sp. UBA4863]
MKAQKITLNLKDVPLKTVFNEIKKQTGFGFWYDNANLIGANNVTLIAKDASIKEILDKCFKGQPYAYEIFDKTIVIKRKPASKNGQTSGNLNIAGKVRDESGRPISGVNIRLKGTDKHTLSSDDGGFSIVVPDENAVLLFTYVGFAPIAQTVGTGGFLNIALKEEENKLDGVEVVSTGFQNLPKERATGSFVLVDSALMSRRVSTGVLDRIDGVTSGLLFNGSRLARSITYNSNIGINIRGVSTLSPDVSKNPLIILDSFPYEGSIDNINPNDVENITVLKDAAAASIWGARSGNGVIVITTKKGKRNQKPQIELNSSFNIGNAPDLFKDRKFLNASEYIDIETHLYSRGFFNSEISNTTTRPVVSPVVEILASSLQQAEKTSGIDAMRTLDYRNDYQSYFYQKSLKQQYSIGIRGGSERMAYSFSGGYDNNVEELVNNGYRRLSINAQNTYTPLKNLDIITALNYTKSITLRNNQLSYGIISVGTKYGKLYPYAQLADENGNALSIVKNYRQNYVNSTAALGFLDWNYRPLDEINSANANDKFTNLLARATVRYRFSSSLNIEALYQNENQKIETYDYHSTQTYYARNLINRFSQYNSTTKTFTYPIPNGGILSLSNSNWISNNGRVQLTFDKEIIPNHQLTAIAGSEIREVKTEAYSRDSYGYDDIYGTAVINLNYGTNYPTNPSSTATIPAVPGLISGQIFRYISYYSNASYTYKGKYIFSISGRKDGSNIFGAKTNDKVTPLWSTGFAWNISRENLYNLAWLPYLKIRGTYGFNGNVYNGSAYSKGTYSTSTDLTGAQMITSLTAPNPELRWEKVRNINLGIDFASPKNRISGSFEFWQKEGLDLINAIPLATSTGFTSFNGNSASTRTNGIDVQLNSQNIKGQFNWNTVVLYNTLKDRVILYNVTQNNTSIQGNSGVALVGKPLFSLYSYKWAGLDPINGDPQGYLNGKTSKDYLGIIGNFNPDSLVYHGSARPTVFGSLRNDFAHNGFSLSFNLVFKMGYYFRRPSTSINYADIINNNGYADAAQAWKVPGDEYLTTVPSLIYPSNANRNNFYQYSSALIEKADHIRLQDIRLAYNVSNKTWKNMPFRACQIYTYATNLGILWRANKHNIDPDIIGNNTNYYLPNPFSIAFGLNVTL